jgi:hypothetical protein
MLDMAASFGDVDARPPKHGPFQTVAAVFPRTSPIDSAELACAAGARERLARLRAVADQK